MPCSIETCPLYTTFLYLTDKCYYWNSFPCVNSECVQMEVQQKSTVDLKLKPTIDCCKYYYKRTCNSRVAGLGVPFS